MTSGHRNLGANHRLWRPMACESHARAARTWSVLDALVERHYREYPAR